MTETVKAALETLEKLTERRADNVSEFNHDLIESRIDEEEAAVLASLQGVGDQVVLELCDLVIGGSGHLDAFAAALAGASADNTRLVLTSMERVFDDADEALRASLVAVLTRARKDSPLLKRAFLDRAPRVRLAAIRNAARTRNEPALSAAIDSIDEDIPLEALGALADSVPENQLEALAAKLLVPWRWSLTDEATRARFYLLRRLRRAGLGPAAQISLAVFDPDEGISTTRELLQGTACGPTLAALIRASSGSGLSSVALALDLPRWDRYALARAEVLWVATGLDIDACDVLRKRLVQERPELDAVVEEHVSSRRSTVRRSLERFGEMFLEGDERASLDALISIAAGESADPLALASRFSGSARHRLLLAALSSPSFFDMHVANVELRDAVLDCFATPRRATLNGRRTSALLPRLERLRRLEDEVIAAIRPALEIYASLVGRRGKPTEVATRARALLDRVHGVTATAFAPPRRETRWHTLDLLEAEDARLAVRRES